PDQRRRTVVKLRRRLFLISMAFLAAPLHAGAKPATLQTNSASTTPAVLDAIGADFEHFRQSAHIPGLVWGIVQNGTLLHVGTLGVQDVASSRPVTADSVFRIASMSKAFTALAILKLRDEGKLSLDDPLIRYVPEAEKWRYPTDDSPKLRLIDLLGHTAGFGPDDPWSDRQQPMSEQAFGTLLANGISFNHVPETQYEYSSLGYALLGRVVTKVSGSGYDRYIEDLFMRPLGMNSSGYEIADVPAQKLAIGYRWENDAFAREPSMTNGAFGAMGGVYTSANDYARWVAFLLSGWPARNDPDTGPAPRAVVREMAIGTSFPRLASRPRPGTAGACSFAAVYSACFNVVRDCDLGLLLTHNGGYPGYGATVLLMPESGVGIFAFDNRTYGVPVGPVFNAAQRLKDAGLLKSMPAQASKPLTDAYRVAIAMYRASSVEQGKDRLAMNFLLDRSAENWHRMFDDLKAKVGPCEAEEPIVATGLLAGTFSWHCNQGTVQGTLELSPTDPPLIQTLSLTAEDKSH
ncbi:MAG: serine hydrolase domain-containing protein, partial [Bryobacteraceae bacterium]